MKTKIRMTDVYFDDRTPRQMPRSFGKVWSGTAHLKSDKSASYGVNTYQPRRKKSKTR